MKKLLVLMLTGLLTVSMLAPQAALAGEGTVNDVSAQSSAAGMDVVAEIDNTEQSAAVTGDDSAASSGDSTETIGGDNSSASSGNPAETIGGEDTASDATSAITGDGSSAITGDDSSASSGDPGEKISGEDADADVTAANGGEYAASDVTAANGGEDATSDVIAANGGEDADADVTATVSEDPAVGDAEKVPYTFDPYLQVKFASLYKAGDLTLPEGMTDIVFTEPKYGNGLLFTGKVGALNAGKMVIAKEFNFDRNPVGRISVDGLADRGMQVKVNIYLDAEEEPAASFTLGSTMGKKDWANAGDHTKGVYARKITGTHTVSIGLEVSGKADNKKTSVLLRSFEFSQSSIPVMYFNIDESKGTIAAMNGSQDHSVECYGSVDIQVPDGYVCEYTGEAAESLNGLKLEYLRGRGNSTWGGDKKPYKVKLDKKTNLFGMGANKHWILLANRYDNTLSRNRMTYWLGAQMGMEYTPQCIPVDVVMNDTYYGSYLLCEQIRVGDNRVEIDDLEDTDESIRRTDKPFITGGYLLSMSPYGNENPDNIFKTSHNVEMFIESPEFEDYNNEAMQKYIRNYVQNTENAIFSPTFKDKNGKPYTDYIDLQAAADYWWIQEFSCNGDAYGSGSTFLYKKRDGKLFWGPLWDFDYVAWGDLQYDSEVPTGFEYTYMPWFEKMRTDAAFNNMLLKEWNRLAPLLDEVTKSGGLLDQYYQQMRISRAYDEEKWGVYIEGYGFLEDEESDAVGHTYEEEFDQLNNWIKDRKAWVADNLDQIRTTEYTVTFKAGSKVVEKRKLLRGNELWDLPKAPAKKGYIFNGWKSDEEGRIFEGYEVYGNLVLKASYIKKSEEVKATRLYFKRYQVSMEFYGEDETIYEPNYSVMPFDATNQDVKWSVSNKDVASVDASGSVIFHKPGTVKVTGTLSSGVKNSYTIHCIDWDSYVELDQPADMYFKKSNITLAPDQFAQNRLIQEPEFCMDTDVTWLSSNPDVAYVDYIGVVTGVSPGKTFIYAIDPQTQLTAYYTVTVKDPKEEAKKAATKKKAISKKTKSVKTKSVSQRTKAKIKKAKARKVKIKGKILKSGKARITWKKKKGVTGYEIYQFSAKTGKYKKIATVKKASAVKWTSKKALKKGTKAYYRVRPYTKIGKKIYRGKWSNIKILKWK